MSTDNLTDQLAAGYANKLADLVLGKNLEDHYIDVSSVVKQINELIDTGKLTEEESGSFMRLGYQYYRLKDQLLDAMVLKELEGK